VPVRQMTAKAPIIILRALGVLLLVGVGEEEERRERRREERKAGMVRRLLGLLLLSCCPGAAAAADAKRGEEEGRVLGRRACSGILVLVILVLLRLRVWVLLGRRGSWNALTVVAAASKARERRRRSRGGRGDGQEGRRVAMAAPVLRGVGWWVRWMRCEVGGRDRWWGGEAISKTCMMPRQRSLILTTLSVRARTALPGGSACGPRSQGNSNFGAWIGTRPVPAAASLILPRS